MKNLKKILNAKSRIFGNFQFFTIYGQKSLSCTQIVFQIRDFVKFVVEELNSEVYFDLP